MLSTPDTTEVIAQAVDRLCEETDEKNGGKNKGKLLVELWVLAIFAGYRVALVVVLMLSVQ